MSALRSLWCNAKRAGLNLHSSTHQVGFRAFARMTPAEYVELYRQSRARPAPNLPSESLSHLCARCVRGKSPSDFILLSDEPDKKLVWVLGPNSMHSLLGNASDAAMMVSCLGMDLPWLTARLREGVTHRLLVWRAEDRSACPATWDNVFAMVRTAYRPVTADRLDAFREALVAHSGAEGFRRIEGSGEIERLSWLPMAEKYAHPAYMTEDRFLAQPPTLTTARAFLYHTLGCSREFRGTGYTDHAKRHSEWFALNRPVAALPSLAACDLTVTEADLVALSREQNA